MANKPTILIIEDHTDLREMFAFGLAVGGYETLMAADGPEGLDLYDEHHPDVVLVDVMLPSSVEGLNGYKISARIKQGNPDAIVVVMTGKDDLPDLRLLDSHADKILTKPLTVEQVISEIEYVKAKREAMNPKQMGAPNKLPLIVAFAALFGALVLGLTGIGAYDWHCNVVLRERADIAHQKDVELIKSLFEQQERNDKTRQDDKYAEMDRRILNAENAAGLQKVYLQKLREEFDRYLGKHK